MKSKLILALGISLGVLSACESDDHDVAFDGVGDIYVRCQKIDNEVKYAPVIYAYGNMYMSDAEVAHSDEDSMIVPLEKLGENTTVFYSAPSIEDFSTDDIKNGTYNFKLTSTDAEILNLTDELLEERIDPIEVTKFEYDNEKHEIDLAWETVEDCDIYHVKIATKIDGQIVFSSKRLNETNLLIKETIPGWDPNYIMKNGTSYTISVSAYKFEDSTESGYHINQESVEYHKIEW